MHTALQIIGGLAVMVIAYVLTGNPEIALVLGILLGIVFSKLSKKNE